PQVTIGAAHGLMDEGADRIHPGVAMGDHHAFRTRGSAASIIDREQISLANFGANKFSRTGFDRTFVVQPVFSVSGQSDEVFYVRKARTNAVDRAEIIAVCANHAGAAVIDEVNEIIRGQAII